MPLCNGGSQLCLALLQLEDFGTLEVSDNHFLWSVVTLLVPQWVPSSWHWYRYVGSSWRLHLWPPLNSTLTSSFRDWTDHQLATTRTTRSEKYSTDSPKEENQGWSNPWPFYLDYYLCYCTLCKTSSLL